MFLGGSGTANEKETKRTCGEIWTSTPETNNSWKQKLCILKCNSLWEKKMFPVIVDFVVWYESEWKFQKGAFECGHSAGLFIHGIHNSSGTWRNIIIVTSLRTPLFRRIRKINKFIVLYCNREGEKRKSNTSLPTQHVAESKCCEICTKPVIVGMKK